MLIRLFAQCLVIAIILYMIVTVYEWVVSLASALASWVLHLLYGAITFIESMIGLIMREPLLSSLMISAFALVIVIAMELVKRRKLKFGHRQLKDGESRDEFISSFVAKVLKRKLRILAAACTRDMLKDRTVSKLAGRQKARDRTSKWSVQQIRPFLPSDRQAYLDKLISEPASHSFDVALFDAVKRRMPLAWRP